MSEPTAENEVKPVKLKQARKKYKAPSPTDRRLKANREPTEAELATRFQAGHTLQKNQRENRIKKVREYRSKLFSLTDAMVPMLADLAYDAYENGDAKTVLEIFKAVTPFAVGRPPEMESEEEQTPETIQQTNIIIATDQYKAAVQSDLDYVDAQVIDSEGNSHESGDYE